MLHRRPARSRAHHRASSRHTVRRTWGSGHGRNCLIVLQPRAIEPCLRSIQSLDIDKVYFRAFTEEELVESVNRFIRQSRYDNYLLVADDVIVNAESLRLVEELLETHEVATGYCRLCQDSQFVNLTRSPLRLSNGEYATLDDYDHYRLDEVSSLTSPVFETWFGGWTLTGVRRQLLLQHPFRVNPTTLMQSDFEFFYELRRPAVAHRDAFVEHLKEHVDTALHRNWIVGRIPPEIRFYPASFNSRFF